MNHYIHLEPTVKLSRDSYQCLIFMNRQINVGGMLEFHQLVFMVNLPYNLK